MGEYAFADVYNLEHCAKYSKQTLVTFGFPASLDLLASDTVSIARTSNCIYSLIQQRQRDYEFRESANEQRQRTRVCFSLLFGANTNLEAKATAAFKAQTEKLQQERDEFQRVVVGNQVREVLAYCEFLFFSSSGSMEDLKILTSAGAA